MAFVIKPTVSSIKLMLFSAFARNMVKIYIFKNIDLLLEKIIKAMPKAIFESVVSVVESVVAGYI